MKYRIYALIFIVVACYTLLFRYLVHLDKMSNVDSRVIQAQTQFGLDVFNALSPANSHGNSIISPSSLFETLSMVYNAGNGRTKSDIEKALRVRGIGIDKLNETNHAVISELRSIDPRVHIDIANSLCVRKGVPLNNDCLKKLSGHYGVKIGTQEDAAGIVQNPQAEDALWLLNTTSFSGEWSKRFDPLYTKLRQFKTADGGVKLVPTMGLKLKTGYYTERGFGALRLAYGSGRLAMYIFLPDRDSSLQDFRRKLNQRDLDGWFSSFDTSEVAVSLPRFAVKWNGDDGLKRALTKLGMGIIFDRNRADLGKVSPLAKSKENLYVAQIKHQATMRVDEAGTAAEAETLALFRTKGVSIFKVDRPFFFMIRDDDTGTILFMGSVTDPTADNCK